MKIKKISLALAVLFLGLITAVNVALAVDSEAACNGKSAGSKCEYNDPIEEKGSCCRIYYKAADDTKGLFCDYRTNYAACCGKTQGSACSFFGMDARKGYETNGIEERKGTCKLDATIHNTIGLLVCEIPPNSTAAANNSTTSTNATASGIGIAPSQCTGACGITQTGCVDNWPALSSQCNDHFPGSCFSIPEYLSAMADDCVSDGQSSRVGGDCAYITSGNHYGACASAYASYVESWGATPTPGATPQTPVTPTPEVNPSNSTVQFSGKGIEIPTGTGLPDPRGGIARIIRNLLTWLLGIVGVIAIIGFVISGIQYLTSAGNEDQMQSAKRNMLYAIIGVVVVLSSFVIIQAIQYALEAKSMF